MVTISSDKCAGCGSCVEICHESCMSLRDGKVQIDYQFCSTCAQCIAICPSGALKWDNYAAEPFDKNRYPSPAQIDELFKQRRTTRHFKEEKPDRRTLQEIINYGAYAPTHSHEFRVIAVDDRDHLDKIDRTAYAYNKKIYKYLYKPKIVSFLVKLFAPLQRGEYLRAKPKLEKSLEMGRGYASLPPILLFIVGIKRTPLSVESAQYILYTIDLYAQSKGLGCRNLVGNQMFFNRSKEIRQMLNVRKDEKIFATLGIGYPTKKFRNKVQGRGLEVRWSN